MKEKKIIILLLIVILATGLKAKNAAAIVTWNPAPALPPVTVGVPYSHQLQAATTNFPDYLPITYTLTAGGIPGLSLSSTGLISGTVAAPGPATITIQAADLDPDNPPPVVQTFTITYLPTPHALVSGVTGPLQIKRLQLRFDNNRPEITVAKNQKPPKLYADLSFIGSGIMRGYWAVDGAIHSHLQENLTSGSELTLPLPPVPPLPTYQSGGHRVRLVITEPPLGEAPQALYYVTEEGKNAFTPLEVISPADGLDVDLAPLSLSWQTQVGGVAYLVEFLEIGIKEPIFSAYTKKGSYTIPAHTVESIFGAKKSYGWQVKALSDKDEIINKSKIHHFTFR
ncbi:MAG: Ig domain-containing protein [Thermodesulfobacteriota bacterium]